jgi:Zn-dependent protease
LFDRRSPGALTIARLHTIEIALHWRWAVMLALASALLAEHVFPARLPTWDLLTLWTTSIAGVLACEVVLLLHELSHALVARGHGLEVQRIVFHGLVAETQVGRGTSPRHEVLIALVGPAMNFGLAACAQTVRLAVGTSGPGDMVLMLLVIGNMATALMSLVPFGGSDGARALQALRAPDYPSARG